MGKGKEYEEAKKTLLSYQDAIKSHPLLENYRSMEKEAREELSEIAEILR